MKKIIVHWLPSKEKAYDQVMQVIYSNHPRFVKGSRFDYGFLGIASREGYIIEVLP